MAWRGKGASVALVALARGSQFICALHSYARELTPYLHGVLPLEDLPAVCACMRARLAVIDQMLTGLRSCVLACSYASAGVVLATTDDAQRALGMVNNRIFEACMRWGTISAPLLSLSV